jgi:hypothetical protein
MKNAVLITLFMTVFGLFCLGSEFKGRVISPQGRPVAGASVFHRASGLKALTDEDGLFSLDLPAESEVTLEFLHPDYMAEMLDFRGKEGEKLVIVILMPYISQREEVVVTAMRHPEPEADIPAASTVVSAETLQKKMAPNIAEALDNLPGLTDLGSGGFSLVPSIRGLARRRVLLMVDNARLSSDRRTGPSASFISPEDIGRVEVMRSPSSVFYGSDAIGGVVHILTREPGGDGRLRGRLNTRFGTVNEEKEACRSQAVEIPRLLPVLSGCRCGRLSLSGRPNLSIPLFSGEPPREGPARDGKKEYLGELSLARAQHWQSRTGTPGPSPPGIPVKTRIWSSSIGRRKIYGEEAISPSISLPTPISWRPGRIR